MPFCFPLCHCLNDGGKPLFYLEDGYGSSCGGDAVMETIIRTEKLDKIYYQGRPEEVRALNQIELEIPKNRLVLIRGPSGSGKTFLT
jgi:ABC-type glutathione transport system ATPase component